MCLKMSSLLRQKLTQSELCHVLLLPESMQIFMFTHMITIGHGFPDSQFENTPGRMFANCGRARYNGARMCKAIGRACAKQWRAHGDGS